MINKIIAIIAIAFLAGCSSNYVSNSSSGTAQPAVDDIIPVFGEYKPVKYSQTLIQESIDEDKNVVRTPVHVMSGATYWKDGYYVIPNVFLDSSKSCVNCLVNFVKAEDIDGKQGISSSKIEWREKKDNEYTFSGWIGRDGVTRYSYIYDISKAVIGDKFVQNINTVNEPTNRTLHLASVTPTGIIAGAPLFGADQKLIGMTVSFDNLAIDTKNTLYISKFEIEKDWLVFKKNVE